jgi:kanamycin kinase
MILKPISADISAYPTELQSFLTNAILYDNSCSPEAKVTYIDKDNGYFLKSAPKGTLERESVLTRYFYNKGLSANVLSYISSEQDWLLTEKIGGDDCTASKYLEQPEQLCDTLAELLRTLHSTDYAGCPIPNHTECYLVNAERNFKTNHFNYDLFSDSWGYASAGEAYQVIKTRGHLLQTDTLLHGDYCLPNIILDNWSFSGFIDLGNGGVGDRHVDLFWAMWTFVFNLKTDNYRARFIDAYGRANVDDERLRIVAAVEMFG